MNEQHVIVPYGEGRAFPLQAGRALYVRQRDRGGQVGDLNVWNLIDAREHLWASRTALYHARQAAKAAWAKLIRKVYEVDPLVCPKCGAQMRVIAPIEDPAVIERILSWLGLWHPLPACGPSPPAEHASLPVAYHPVPDIA